MSTIGICLNPPAVGQPTACTKPTWVTRGPRTWAVLVLLLLTTASLAQGQKVLHSFAGGADGANPYGGLALDARGNLYGSTQKDGPNGSGTVFALAPSDKETVILGFGYAPSGAFPPPALVFDSNGNLYGTTSDGGTFHGGTLFEVTPSGEERILYNFACSGAEACMPNEGLTIGADGNLYGTSYSGGAYDGGTFFKATPTGAVSILFSFGSGVHPNGGLITDAKGNFYGTTYGGGTHGLGTVYELTP